MATSPVLRDLSFLQKTFLPICSEEEWHIPVMKDDDVVWSIVLAYLNSFSDSKKADVNLHVKCLLGKKVGRNITKCVEKCNPFLYRNACFCNEIINNLVQAFKIRIDDYYQMHRNLFPVNQYSYKCLQASSVLLSCNIILCDDSANGFVKLFPEVFPFAIFPKKIIIFVKWETSLDDNSPYAESFSFCMPKELGFKKQKKALQEIIMKTKFAESQHHIKSVINSICALPDIRENFLISILKSDLAEYIPFVYKSPYVLSKLRNAAIETDPTIENEEGKSALFYALTRNTSNLLYFLYDYAVNACGLTEGTIRSPDPVIVMNLITVKGQLKELNEKLKSSYMDENVKKNSLQKLSELCRFNDFQTNVCRSVNSIRLSTNCCSKEDEAEQRKDVIINILQNYEKYFEWKDWVEYSKDDFSPEFYIHSDYFDNLDFCSAIMFFDNLFLLKERLLLSDKSYLKIESQFFFFIYCRKYFETTLEESPRLRIASRMVIFQERLLLKSHIRSFKGALELEDIRENNTVDKLPESEVRTLTNIPQIYGEFLVLRLKRYLEAAANIRVIDMKAILILQRTLQVIGECIKESDFKSVQKIFSLILPEELVSNLKQIRNELAHPKEFNLSYRIFAEEDQELFNRIKAEIATLKNILNPIFCAQRYGMDQYVLLITQRAVHKAGRKKIPELHKPKIMAILPPPEVETQITKTGSFQNTWKKYFSEIYHSFSSTIASLNRDEKVISKTTIAQFNYIFKNMFCSFKKEVNFMKSHCNNIKESVDTIDDYFWSVEYLIVYVTKDKKLKTSLRRKLLKKIHERRALFQHAIKNMRSKKKNINDTERQVDVKNGDISTQNENNSANVPDFVKLYNGNGEAEHAEKNENIAKSCVNSEDVNSIPKELVDTKGNQEENDRNIEEANNNKIFHQAIADILSDYEQNVEEIFLESNCKYNQFNFDNIDKFKKILKGYYYINGKEKKIILNSIPEDIQIILKAKQVVKNFLEETGCMQLNKEEFEIEINKLPLKAKEIKELSEDFDLKEKKNSLSIINSVLRDYITELEHAIAKNEVGKKKYENLCKFLNLPENSKNILSKIVQGQKCSIRGNQLEFLRNRIKHLKAILIDENMTIKQLWETAKSSRKKTYVHERIVHVYLNDPGIQASVEMLLFDCMNILRTKDLKNLCRKTTNLFNGINLRNVLAHGNPLLESLGRLLDPYDLPSELVRKMLHLISDLEIIDCMVTILKQSGYKLSIFMRIMNEDEDGEFKILREKIADCDNWKEYALLIPEDETSVDSSKQRIHDLETLPLYNNSH